MPERSAFKGVLNFDSREQKRTFLAGAGILRGLYRVSLEPARDKRSSRQNAFYWLVLSRAAKWLTEGTGGQRVYQPEQIHRAMGRRFLDDAVTDPDTGEVLDRYTRSTTTLSVQEMTQYIDRVQARLDEKYGIPPLEAEEPETVPARREGVRA